MNEDGGFQKLSAIKNRDILSRGWFSRFNIRFNLYFAVGLIFLVKFILFAIDSRPCFFMGDSASYLYTALSGWAPADRSYTYGLFIAFVMQSSRSLQQVIFFQMLLSAAAASLVAVILRKTLAASLFWATLCGICCALEPLQLLSERFILTEAPSTFVFAILVGLSLFYLKTGNWLLLLAIPLSGVYLVSLRVSFLPAVLLNMLLPLLSPPAVRMWRAGVKKMTPGRDLLLLALHLALVITVTAVAIWQYAVWNGRASDSPPSINSSDGFFLLAEMAPLVTAADFPDASLGRQVLAATKLDPRDPRLRTAQHFAQAGLCETLIRTVSPTFSMPARAEANRIARTTAFTAVRNDPFGFGRLVFANIKQYFDSQELTQNLEADEFRDQPLEEGYQKLVRQFDYKVVKQPAPGPVMNWHLHAGVWYQVLLLLPFAVSVYWFFSAPATKRQLLLMTLYAWSQWVVCTVLIERATPRFETALAWLFFPIAGLIADQLTTNLKAKGKSGLSAGAIVTAALYALEIVKAHHVPYR